MTQPSGRAGVVAVIRRHAPVVVVCSIVFVIGLAWALSNPPGAAPDEPSHYVRMVGLSQGDVRGADLPPDYLVDLGFEPGPKEYRLRVEAGLYRIPGAAPPPTFCNRFQPQQPWTCTLPPAVPGTIEAMSMHARVQPLPYVVPAVFSLFADSTNQKLYLGRFGFLLQNTLLVGLIVVAMRRVIVAPWLLNAALLSMVVTPLLAFQIGTLAPNATETLAIAAFAAWLLAFLRTPSRRLLVGAAALGCVGLLTRDLGPLLVPSVAVLVFVATPDARAALRSNGRRPLLVAGGSMAAAFVAAVLWRVANAGPLGDLDLTVAHVRHELWSLGFIARSSVSLVGSLDVSLDRWASMLWLVLLGVVTALRAGRSRRSWCVVLAAALLWTAVNVVVAITTEAAGYGNQARYTLVIPIVMALCLVSRAGSWPLPRWAAWATFVVALGVAAVQHLAIIVINAQRHANGLNGTPISFSDPVWAPAFGWRLPLTIAAIGTAWFVGGVVWLTWAAGRDQPPNENT